MTTRHIQPGQHPRSAPATPDPDDLLFIGDAARVAQVSVETLRRWERVGKITAVRTPGGQRRFRRGDLDALMAGGSQ